MITILPLTDQAKIDAVRAENRIDEPCTLLAMCDGEDMLGFAAVRITEQTLEILRLQAGTAPFTGAPIPAEGWIFDSLLRAAASYAEHFGADRLRTSFPDAGGFLQARGFSPDGSCAEAPVSAFIHYKS